MGKRFQVLLSDQEMSEIQRLADQERISVGEWVRRTLREARSRRSTVGPQFKLKSVRQASEYSFPTAEIDQMLAQIEQGYAG